MQDKLSPIQALIGMTFTGLLIGMGQLLASTEKITPRIVIGRAFSSVGLALVAGVGLLQVPNMPLIALIGLSALFSSLGTSALETLFQRYMGIK